MTATPTPTPTAPSSRSARRHAQTGARTVLPLRRAREDRPVRRWRLRHAALLGAVAVLALAGLTVPLSLSTAPAVSAAPDLVLPPDAEPLDAVGAAVGPPTESEYKPLRVGDLDRGYVLLPALGLDDGEQAALLVVLHQDVSSGREVSVNLGLDSLRREGVTLAYPNGFGGSWNSGACCGIAAERRVDDVGFVNAVLDDVGRHTPIDADRRALLGYSGGGMLAYKLLCRPHPRLIAVVEINGSLETQCRPGLELPDLLSVHGEKDGSIGLTASRFVNHLGMAPRSVTSTLTTITEHAACGPQRERTVNAVRVWTYAGCRGGGDVDVHIVPDAGHGWADVGGAARAAAWLLPRLR